VRRVLRWLKAAVGIALVLSLALVGATFVTMRQGDATLFPADPAETIPIFLTSNGFHSGLVLPVPEVARLASRDGAGALVDVAARFAAFSWVEVGWGEARFYREVPAVSLSDLRSILRALFNPGNGSVLHVVGFDGDPRRAFGHADIIRLPLSERGLAGLLRLLNASFARDEAGLPEPLGPGLYGASLFYRAVGSFSILNVCNHWTARLLDAAGVPTSPVLAILPLGLLWDLQRRSGLGSGEPEPDRDGAGPPSSSPLEAHPPT
jgi:uncharacterized protein (TIGR02117 family)